MSLVKKRPKVGDVIRFALRHGSAPALVLDRYDRGASRVADMREGKIRHIDVPDALVVYINGKLTGNEADDD